eukprot:scaffold59884_cov22-Tisochrysis_lutea.AAC.3
MDKNESPEAPEERQQLEGPDCRSSVHGQRCRLLKSNLLAFTCRSSVQHVFTMPTHISKGQGQRGADNPCGNAGRQKAAAATASFSLSLSQLKARESHTSAQAAFVAQILCGGALRLQQIKSELHVA